MDAALNLLKDKDAKIKIEVCSIFQNIKPITNVINGRNLVLGLRTAAMHRRFKVRLASVKALKGVIVRKDCQVFFETVEEGLRSLAMDKNKVICEIGDQTGIIENVGLGLENGLADLK